MTSMSALLNPVHSDRSPAVCSPWVWFHLRLLLPPCDVEASPQAHTLKKGGNDPAGEGAVCLTGWHQTGCAAMLMLASVSLWEGGPEKEGESTRWSLGWRRRTRPQELTQRSSIYYLITSGRVGRQEHRRGWRILNVHTMPAT